MSVDRFYCENITEPVCQLDGAEAKHIAKVMRAKIGQNIELFDGKGRLAESEEELLINSGTKAISICDTILRVETAAIAFAAILAAKRSYSSCGGSCEA